MKYTRDHNETLAVDDGGYIQFLVVGSPFVGCWQNKII